MLFLYHADRLKEELENRMKVTVTFVETDTEKGKKDYDKNNLWEGIEDIRQAILMPVYAAGSYEVVNNISTLDELRKAYKKLVVQHHPDNGGSDDSIKEINTEYDELFRQIKDGYNAYFREFCSLLYSYQYVEHDSVISDSIIQWLYENSAGMSWDRSSVPACPECYGLFDLDKLTRMNAHGDNQGRIWYLMTDGCWMYYE